MPSAVLDVLKLSGENSRATPRVVELTTRITSDLARTSDVFGSLRSTDRVAAGRLATVFAVLRDCAGTAPAWGLFPEPGLPVGS